MMETFFDVFIFISGLAIGFILNYIFNRKKEKLAEAQIEELKLKETQLQSDYSILLQAMEGAKAQAEDMQRQLYGTNVMEVKRFQHPEYLLNRQKVVRFVEKKLKGSSSQSDDSAMTESSNYPQALESIKALDEKVVQILSAALEDQ